MYGLSDKEFDEMTDIFGKCKNLEKVILYGSRAKGNYKKFSDVDITLEGDNLTLADLFQIQDLLYESDLPYMYDVSIFSSITNPDLIDHIKRRGIVIWERG
ncbi:MAG: nucleotidyltransferase domain-containing protein [Bacteroidales bacterium]|nr:nucleotidyltransferase domain-containing protein [Bacteroidales bacterium]